MMEEKKSVVGSRLWLCALGTSLVALVVYALTLPGYVFPCESTHLFTQWMGMDALPRPSSPLWGRLVRMVGNASFPASMGLRMNLFSLVCGVLASGLVCLLVGFFVRRTVKQEESVKMIAGASMAAGLVAGLVFVFSPAMWRASTHLDYRIFDVLLSLVLFTFFIPMARGGKGLVWWSMALGIGVALGVVESPIFIPLAAVYLLAVMVSAMKAGKKPYVPAVLFLVMLGLFFVVFSHMVASSYLKLPEAAAGNAKSALDVMLGAVRADVHELRLWVARSGWLYVIIFTVLPFVACMFAAPRGLNNERTWSQYLFHAAMTVCALLALATPLSPEGVMRKFGFEPVATSTLAAIVAGYVTAYWLILFRTAPVEREGTEVASEAKLGSRIAPVVLGIFLVLVGLATMVNMFGMSRDRGAFADICANEILDRLGNRTWLVTDGMLDDHLRVAAKTRGKELHLVCLQRDMEDAYLKELEALIKEKQLKADGANLELSIQLGVLPFLQDWLGGDPKVTETLAVFGVPDLWYMAKAKPVPDCLFFTGVRDLAKDMDGKKTFDDFMAFWKKIEPVLFAVEKGKGSRSIMSLSDPLDVLRMHLRRHVGFLANNLGVTLQDVKMDKEAFELYELVMKTIDPDNISALFNEFELARSGFAAAVGRQREIVKQVQAIVDDSSRRYALWSLARWYGYIRSAEIFVRMGHGWANSALPGNAITHLQHARDLVPADRQAGLLNMLASAYASDNQTQKSRELYEQILSGDDQNHDALIGLMRLELQKGNYEAAMKYLEKAVKSGKNPEAEGFDVAFLHMMKNDLDAARLTLQKVTDMKPKSMEAWSLLSGVLLQQHDQAKTDAEKKKAMDELETMILPKMQSIASGPRDYHVQMTRAMILMRKGKEFQKEARDALIVASAERPNAAAVGDMILDLDIKLVDIKNAEKHARQILRTNRRNKLANYVMGSIRLQNEDYATAETFLRLSVSDEKPLASAQNDLAEVLRRMKKYAEAEKVARDAVKNEPELYVAWETLASILLDQKKDFAEAEECAKKSIELVKKTTGKEDVRMFITLARAQLAKGDMVHYNTTVRTLNSRRNELSPLDRQALEDLQKSARGKH